MEYIHPYILTSRQCPVPIFLYLLFPNRDHPWALLPSQISMKSRGVRSLSWRHNPVAKFLIAPTSVITQIEWGVRPHAIGCAESPRAKPARHFLLDGL